MTSDKSKLPACPGARLPVPRVVVVGRGTPERGGIPTFLDMLVHGQEALGYRVELVNLTPAAGSLGGRASLRNTLRTLSDAKRVLATVRRGDIVHVHSALAPTVTCLRAGLLLAVAHARGGHPVVHAHGGRLTGQSPSVVHRLLIRLALRPARLVIAVATGVRQALIDHGVAPARVRLLTNGVAVQQFDVPPMAHPGLRVMYVGGLTPRKGVLDLLAASTQLFVEGLPHELWLVGGIPDEGPAARQEVLDRLPQHARLLGALPPQQMPSLYAQVDVFCLPSWWEAMPLTVLEAQAAGLPVLATDVGDVSLAVLDGKTGTLVPPRDRAALTSALRELLTDPALRSQLGAEARRHVRAHFDQTEVLHELHRTFNQLRGVS